jgi:hypothetical protein
MTALLDRILCQTKNPVPFASQESIKTKTNSPVARMTALLDRILCQTKNRVPFASQESIKIRTISQVVKVAAEELTTIRLDKPSVPNVERASTTKQLNRLLNQPVKIVSKESGQMILDVLLVAHSATKDSTTIK